MGLELRALMRFSVLGALEATRDDEPIRLGGERQRALLALLLVHANELVSTERLISQLFGEDPSGTAANALHVAVSRLRRTLQSGDEGPLLTRPGGYMLALASDQLDAIRFERQLAVGRDLLATGDAGAASARLREALGMWRGAPLADVAVLEFLQPEVRRLQELRLLAQMDWIDAELALGHHAELTAEIESLVASEPLQERLRGQLMLALYRSGRRADALAVYRQTSRLLREELGLEPTLALQELERMILHQETSPAVEGSVTTAESPTADDRGAPAKAPDVAVVCPFKGLAVFDTADAEFYCGRERLVSDLVARLAESTLVGILGPSGIGKSSLLRAGVLPALRGGALPRSSGWRQVLLRPGAHPCAELERVLGGELETALAALSPGERIVIAIDQLEELFTTCASEGERSTFLEQLVAAARDPDRRVLVLCALRADFYGRFGAEHRFAELLSHSHALVGPMDRDELTQAIEQPARRAGLTIELPLVAALVAEVADEPGGLPLLSTTLLELWLARDGRSLRFETYRTIGGVHGAVARMAEAAFAKLDEPRQEVARSLLLRLVIGDEDGLVRRRVSLEELEQAGDDGDAQRVLATLIDARLLTVTDGEVELSHEALMREWPRYRAWLDEDRGSRRVHAHLIAAAREWERRGHDPADLYRGTRLTAAIQWRADNGQWCNALEREFLDAGWIEADRSARRQRSQSRRLRSLRLAAGALLVLAVLAAAFALAKQRSASDAARAAAADARAALGRQLGAEAVSEPRLDLAMLLARVAVDLNRSQQTEGTLLATLLRSPSVIGSFALPTPPPSQLAVSPDGRTLAISDDAAGMLRFYDTAAHAVRRSSLSDFTGDQAPVYSDDGSLLLYPTDQGAVQRLAVRDAHSLAMLAELQFDQRFSSALTGDLRRGSILISSDRRSVYYAYWVIGAGRRPGAAYVDRWTLPGGRLVSSSRIASGPLLAMRLIDRDTRLLTVSAGHVELLDARSMRPVRSEAIAPAPDRPSAAAISPDGRTVAMGSQSGSTSFINPLTGGSRPGSATHRSPVAGIFYARSGQTVSTVGDDNTVIVWNPHTGAPVQTLAGPAGQVQSAAATRDGTTLYTSSLDGQLLVWDLTGLRRFGRTATFGRAAGCCSPLSPHAPPLAISSDGSQFAARVGPSSVGLFSASTLRRERTFTISPRGEGITALAWSPTAPLVAVAGHSGFVQLWHVGGAPRLERSLVGLHAPPGRPEAIQALAFSPDGALLAATDQNETRSSPNLPALPAAFLAVWSTSTGGLTGAPRDLEVGSTPGGSDPLAFSPGGRMLATGLPDGRVLILDPVTGQVVRTLAPASRSTALAFAPSGTLATGTVAGTVELWNPADGRRLVPALIAASAPITSVAFDPSGQSFATTGDQDGTVRLWFASTLQQEGPALPTEPGAASAAAFAASGQTLLAVQDRGTADSWPASLGAWERRACSVAGRNLSPQEWDRLVAEPHYRTICR